MRRFVGEGDHQHIFRGQLLLPDQVDDTFHQSKGFSRPGTGNYQYWPFGSSDGLLLGRSGDTRPIG